MERHRTDFVELFFGLVLLAAGAGFVVHQVTGRAFDAGWIAAIALVAIGSVFLAATLIRRPHPELATVAEEPAAEPVDDPAT